MNSNFFRGEHIVEKLTAKGATNEVTAVLEGGHNWATADEHMRQTLPLHWVALGPATIIGDSAQAKAAPASTTPRSAKKRGAVRRPDRAS